MGGGRNSLEATPGLPSNPGALLLRWWGGGEILCFNQMSDFCHWCTKSKKQEDQRDGAYRRFGYRCLSSALTGRIGRRSEMLVSFSKQVSCGWTDKALDLGGKCPLPSISHCICHGLKSAKLRKSCMWKGGGKAFKKPPISSWPWSICKHSATIRYPVTVSCYNQQSYSEARSPCGLQSRSEMCSPLLWLSGSMASCLKLQIYLNIFCRLPCHAGGYDCL